MPFHKIVIKNGDRRYLCNQACKTTKAKSTFTWKLVTCKNCLNWEITKKKYVHTCNNPKCCMKGRPLPYLHKCPICGWQIRKIRDYDNEVKNK